MVDIVDKALRMGEGRQIKKLEGVAKAVNALEDEISALSDEELKGQTAKFKQQLENGKSLDELMPEAFATVREASKRVLGQRHFDVQLMGGAALHWGNIAEMKTGEGKTLVATLPSYLNALEGKGVHVVTVNDYLASYQSEIMGRIYRFLGMSVGCIITNQKPPERRKQYNADITYGTNNEFGFDYLRDNMAWEKADLVQRGHHYAIVDEVDSILIDEARTPLIISGPAEGDVTRWYREFAKLVVKLTRDEDYEVDEKKKVVGILDPGITKVEDFLGIDNLYEPNNTALIGYLNNAIKAKELFLRDRDYVVTGGEVLIDGTDVRDYPLAQLHAQVGMVLQNNVLFSGTIADNLRWGREDASPAEMEAAARAAQAHDFVMSFPDGYDAVLGRGGVNLSGGQKQRLCIARALLRRPKILLLDDSTSAVDTETELKIRRGLREYLGEGTTVFVSTQRVKTMEEADRVLVLDDGKVESYGTPARLKEDSAVYREIFNSQQLTF